MSDWLAPHVFAGQVALVTAAAGAGIGSATAEALAAAGATVVLTDQHEERARATAGRISEKTGTTVVPMVLDVTDEQAIADVVLSASRDVGPIDILVNNAGLTRAKPLTEMSTETWRLVLDVCLTSQFLTMRAVLPGMIERGCGAVINLASSYGWLGTNTGEAHYIAAKAGVMGLTRAAAAEAGPHGVRVNAIAPGLIFNEFLRRHYDQSFFDGVVSGTPLGRPGKPEDVANVVLFLASPASGFVTGDVICVSGGWYMHA